MWNGMERLPWSQEIKDRIAQAVHNECRRTMVARRFVPVHGPIAAGSTTVPSDIILSDQGQLIIREQATIPLIELSAEFKLTRQQVQWEGEGKGMAGVTLATRAANSIARAEDLVIFQGRNALQDPLFTDNKVKMRSGPPGPGMLEAPELNATPEVQIVPVPALNSSDRPPRYGENTFAAVAEAYSRLQGGQGLPQSHYGPYALGLAHRQYADTHAPLQATLIMPADRIKALLGRWPISNEEANSWRQDSANFYGTGTIPDRLGVLVSLGGHTMELVVGVDTVTSFTQEDTDGMFCFRVWERFAYLLKDFSGIVRLVFAAV